MLIASGQSIWPLRSELVYQGLIHMYVCLSLFCLVEKKLIKRSLEIYANLSIHEKNKLALASLWNCVPSTVLGVVVISLS